LQASGSELSDDFERQYDGSYSHNSRDEPRMKNLRSCLLNVKRCTRMLVLGSISYENTAGFRVRRRFRRIVSQVGCADCIARNSSMWSDVKSDGVAKLMQHLELALK
jgi:hypothetical protein